MLPVSRVPGGQSSSSLWHMCALPSRPPLKQRRDVLHRGASLLKIILSLLGRAPRPLRLVATPSFAVACLGISGPPHGPGLTALARGRGFPELF